MSQQPQSAVTPPASSTSSPSRIIPTSVHLYRSPPSPAETERADSDLEAASFPSGVEPEDDSKRQRPYPLPPPSNPVNVLAEDLKTPDRHVQRDPRLIRLTGVHPFNVEPPMTELYKEGFLTTKNLHFVRNHGAVPEVQEEDVMDWEFSVEGMVKNPMKITLRQLLADYEQLTYPVTLVCAGNRRKEQNIVRKTKGFSWGASGLSTAIWTGVPLGELLEKAKPVRGATYVRFEGADKLPNGHYGTSVKLAWARNSERGILVAHKMNGEPLPPDHGRPLRVVVPGNIGGRSVKWLKRIIVAAEPSDSWYHIYDNRVLPTMISPEASADLPDVWRDERYAIYDLNTNSAICFPAHEERMQVASGGGGGSSSQTYNVRGYAYSGGGKRVARVELTLDKGRSWRLADVEYPEDRYRQAAEGERLYGGRIDVVGERSTSFCWCFWNVDVPAEDLQTADDMMVRGMDDSMMAQPRDMYWSVLGMMNNPWFRVVIHKEAGSDTLRFEHPAPPRLTDHGWMERVKKAGGNLTNGFWGEKMGGEQEEGGENGADGAEQKAGEVAKEICMTDEKKAQRIVTLEELRAHENDEEPWFVVQGHVYDGTAFLEGHPGGAPSITAAAAQDVTEEFMAIHSENAKLMMPGYHVGVLDKAALEALSGGDGDGEAGEKEDGQQLEQRAVFLQSKAWSKALLTAKTAVSADTKIFSFQLGHAEQLLGLPIGQHLMVRLRDPVTREVIMRAYTPLSMELPGQPGTGVLDILIKIYYDAPGRPGGRMSQALDSLPLGHAVDFKGPIGHFEYLGGGRCAVGSGKSVRQRRVRRFVMVCGGSGITPVFQVLRAVLAASAADDPTQCLLLDGNRTETDILCRAELDALAAAHADRFRVIHVLSRPEKDGGWTGQRGRMDAAFFQREVGRSLLVPEAVTEPAPEPKSKSKSGLEPEPEVELSGDLVLVCGPEPMEASVRQIFPDMGWPKEDIHFF